MEIFTSGRKRLLWSLLLNQKLKTHFLLRTSTYRFDNVPAKPLFLAADTKYGTDDRAAGPAELMSESGSFDRW